MELTRDLLEARRAQLLADYHALQGALQQVDWSLDKLDEAPDQTETPGDEGLEEGA